MGKTINIGKVGLTMEGDYDPLKKYASKSCISYNHESWFSRKDVPAGIVPGTNAEYWQKAAERGGIGPKGDKGNAAYISFEVDNNMNLVFSQIAADGELDLNFSIDDNGNLIATK